MGKVKKPSNPNAPQPALPFNRGSSTISVQPAFDSLLAKPAVKLELPKDFERSTEAAHLLHLWQSVEGLRTYEFDEFIYAGGSGMVFRVREYGSASDWAMKIPRKKALQAGLDSQVSPFSETEISALKQVSHPNLVRLHEQIKADFGVVGLVTTYVEKPSPLDEYLRETLAKDPDPKGVRGITPFSPKRLEGACAFLVERFKEMGNALAHMHEKGLYHCDVKPANILIGKSQSAILTDLGSCVTVVDLNRANAGIPLRIRFTWTYGHPDLHDLAEGDVRSISGGGLKVSANVDPSKGIERFDLFALGRTIQEALAELVKEFGERCYASYGFRFLHMIACLLLDGKNAPVKERIVATDGRAFVSDIALDYPADLYDKKKILTAAELVNKLERFSRDYSWNGRIPELDSWQPEIVNTGARIAPYSERVAAIFKHPSIRRLRTELQLGWTREVYPGATHSRWSHTLGVLANVAEYYNALLADPELPTARILLDEDDIEHGLLAAILHDIGQTAFGHDLEVVNRTVFDHKQLIPKLLKDDSFGSETLEETINRHWRSIRIERVLSILDVQSGPTTSSDRLYEIPADGLARDMIDGPIDADKLDYLIRDSAACGVPYGLGIDRGRFLKTLTVDVKQRGKRSRLALAYRAKGSAAVESLLLARYQMYGAVYWHHTYRCVQAMFVHAASSAFGPAMNNPSETERIQSAFYNSMICNRSFGPMRKSDAETMPSAVRAEPALEFVWRFANSKNRKLVEQIATRDLYKRVYEIRTGELDSAGEYSALQGMFMPEHRVSLAEALETHFLNTIQKKISSKHGPTESISENRARAIAQQLAKRDRPLIVVDYPIKGIPDEKNIPIEIGDPARKYISGRIGTPSPPRDVFNRVRRLQIEIATARVFAEPMLHELIVRYLDPSDVEECVFSALPFLKSRH